MHLLNLLPLTHRQTAAARFREPKHLSLSLSLFAHPSVARCLRAPCQDVVVSGSSDASAKAVGLIRLGRALVGTDLLGALVATGCLTPCHGASFEGLEK